MKALVQTYQGEEIEAEYLGEFLHVDDEWWTALRLDGGNYLRLRSKDVRAITTEEAGLNIKDLLGDVPADGGLPSSGGAPQPSEPPSESSAPEGT